MTSTTRAPRTRRVEETREAEEREPQWVAPSVLPEPEPRDGVSFKWVRTDMVGKSDTKNVSKAFRSGYVACRRADFPEFQNLITDEGSKYPEGIEVGGLLLCQIDSRMVAQRNKYYAQKGQAQIDSIDNHYLRESDSRMPVSRGDISRRSTTS